MPLTAADVELLRSIVQRRSGNVLTDRHSYLMESKLIPIAQRFGLPNVQALVAEVKRWPLKYEDSIAEAMTINETSFFRDAQPFESLRKVVVPALLAERAACRQLTIWSGASSSGQEPYSIAMLLREHFPQLTSWNVKILATDISEDMLNRTREGLYTKFEIHRGLPLDLLSKFFRREGMQWRVHAELRGWLDCRKLNLAGAWANLPRFDIVFLRNVLIYFDSSMKESILRRVAAQMSDDGYLFLGGGESLVSLNVPFQSEPCGHTVCFRLVRHPNEISKRPVAAR